jgi:hypothetical protein
MIIKFDPLNLPAQSIIDQIQLREVEIAPSVMGWLVTDQQSNDIMVTSGDYFIIYDATEFKIVLRTAYLASASLQRLVRSEIGIDLLEAIADAFDGLPISDANKLSICNTTAATRIEIQANKFEFAKDIYTATATTANFTTGVKNAGMALIDAAIAKL